MIAGVFLVTEAGFAAILAYREHEKSLTGAARDEWHQAYLDSGRFLWNAGIFIMPLRRIAEIQTKRGMFVLVSDLLAPEGDQRQAVNDRNDQQDHPGRFRARRRAEAHAGVVGYWRTHRAEGRR